MPCLLTAAALFPTLSAEEGRDVLDYMVGSRQGCILGSACAPNTKRLLTGGRGDGGNDTKMYVTF